MNKMHLIHMLICFIYQKCFESGILVSSMSKLCEDTDGCANQYRCDLAIYLMTVLSSSYGIITYPAINEPGHRNIVVHGLNATVKLYMKEKRNLLVN